MIDAFQQRFANHRDEQDQTKFFQLIQLIDNQEILLFYLN